MEASAIPPQDLKAEEAVLGAMLTTERALDLVLGGTSLAAEHFYRPRHAPIFRAITALAGRGEPVDVITVGDELGAKLLEEVGGPDALVGLAAGVAVPGNAGTYAKAVIKNATWRQRRRAIGGLVEAIDGQDENAFAAAETALRSDAADADYEYEPDRLRQIVAEMAEGDHEPGLEFPFRRLTQLTTIRRGNLVVVSGHSHFGKSQFTDQMLDHLSRQGHDVRLYINEMDADERVARTVTRRLKIPTRDLEEGRLSTDQQRLLLKDYLNADRDWGITNIAGWNAERVAHHIQRHQRDLVVVDILHNFAYEHERDIDNIVGTLQIAAKVSRTAVVLVAHVNRIRTSMTVGVVKPRPTGADLRASGSIYDRADIVCFVHREQDEETGEPLDDAEIYIDKARRGRMGGMKARFDHYGRFLPVDTTHGGEPA